MAMEMMMMEMMMMEMMMEMKKKQKNKKQKKEEEEDEKDEKKMEMITTTTTTTTTMMMMAVVVMVIVVMMVMEMITTMVMVMVMVVMLIMVIRRREGVDQALTTTSESVVPNARAPIQLSPSIRPTSSQATSRHLSRDSTVPTCHGESPVRAIVFNIMPRVMQVNTQLGLGSNDGRYVHFASSFAPLIKRTSSLITRVPATSRQVSGPPVLPAPPRLASSSSTMAGARTSTRPASLFRSTST
eukprot:754856-Hanusia_phi.AAC.5